MVVVADMQAYLVPSWVGGDPLQWFESGDERLAKVLYRERCSGLEDRSQGAVIRVNSGSDSSLE